MKTRNDVFLTLNLGFEISLEISETDIISCFASFQILNLSLESNKISFIQFIWFNFLAIGWDNSVSNSHTHVVNFVTFLLLWLNFLIFNVFHLFTFLTVLFVKTERVSALSNYSLINNFCCSLFSETFASSSFSVVDWRPWS